MKQDKERTTQNLVISSIALRPAFAEKIEIAARAQGISKAEFFRRCAINELTRLGIKLTPEEMQMKQGSRTDIPTNYVSKRELARRKRREKTLERLVVDFPELAEKVKDEVKEIPVRSEILQNFYKREVERAPHFNDISETE